MSIFSADIPPIPAGVASQKVEEADLVTVQQIKGPRRGDDLAEREAGMGRFRLTCRR
jgi:hypothetical protein